LAASSWAQTAPVFSQIVVFGDSLSDDGNVGHVMEDQYFFSYPGGDFNYSDSRFTNSSDTDPGSDTYAGTWHEQLGLTFLGLRLSLTALMAGQIMPLAARRPRAVRAIGPSSQIRSRSAAATLPLPWTTSGKQVDDYLASNTPDRGRALYRLGRGNDLFDDDSSSHVTETAANVEALVEQLANAGARNILVPKHLAARSGPTL
jgi:phospholipase/lecithinase/hemolysin